MFLLVQHPYLVRLWFQLLLQLLHSGSQREVNDAVFAMLNRQTLKLLATAASTHLDLTMYEVKCSHQAALASMCAKLLGKVSRNC